jgi:Kef-type K+ transport system membrane component KefB
VTGAAVAAQAAAAQAEGGQAAGAFAVPPELIYVALLFGLFVVPKWLQRFRLPSAITSLLLGVGAAAAGVLQHDPTLKLLSTFGIVALFLFAGLEIDADDLRRGSRILVRHLAIQLATLLMVAAVAREAFELSTQAALLVALALLTPSCGFILDSLRSFGLSPDEEFWTKSKAIAAELLALGTLFVTLQSSSALRLVLSSLAMAALIVVIPILFRWFARRIAPFAPRSEFAFLLMVAVLCAQATLKLGVYYLVGAFLVGVAAQRFREMLPAMSSEKMLHAIEAFASIFVPFYFFYAGLHIDVRRFGPAALGLGLAFLAIIVPLRVATVVFVQKFLRRESFRNGTRIGLSLVPTLVFTLVLAEILRDRFGAPPFLFGGLIVYTVVNTLLPGFILKAPPPEYDSPHLAEAEAAPAAGTAGDGPG